MNLIALDLIYYTVTVTPDIQQNYHSFILCMSTTQLLLLACYTGHETFHLFYRHGEWFLGVGKVVFLTFFVHWYTVMFSLQTYVYVLVHGARRFDWLVIFLAQ